MSLKGSRNSISSSKNVVTNEEIAKINQDVTILQSRISHLNGDPIVSTPPSTVALIGNGTVTSSFVSGLRGITTDTSKGLIDNSLELKVEALESVLQKIIELDRLVLKKTAPVDSIAVRRKSNGSDLYLLPTHLHLADRLMDLHTQSKRVTVITQTTSNNNNNGDVTTASSSNAPNPPLSPRSNKKITDNLQNSINDLKKQLQESEDKYKRTQEEMLSSRKDIMLLRQELDNTKLELEQQKLNAKNNNNNEMNTFKAQFSEMQERNNQMQDWLLTEKKKNQSLLIMIKEKAMKLEIKGALTPSKSEQLEKVEFSIDEIEAFSLLDSAIASCFENLRTQIMTISSVKDMLESEIQNYTMERELLMKDLTTLTNEHDALKGAYHALETETMNKKEDTELQKKLKAAQEMIEQVQSELASMARRSLELERLPPILSDIEIKFKASEDSRIKNDFKVKELTEELNSYKQLCEKLKSKIREMSGKDTKAQDFLDSFEEVMRDEMMTMKMAFESKLKQAKDEADDKTRRHQEEILRLSSGSPFLGGLRKDSMGNFIRS